MRRWMIGLVCLLLLFGCAGGREETGKLLYFQERDLRAAAGGGALRTETIQVEETETQAVAETLVEALLRGPLDETLKSPIPKGTALLSLELQGSRAVVDFSAPYGTLSGVALTLADQAVTLTLTQLIPKGTALLSLELQGSRAVVDFSAPYGTLSGVALTLADQAVTLTLTQLPDILSVQITVRGRELAYRSKQVLTAREVLVAPEGDVVGTLEARLWFPDEDGTLTEEDRTLVLYEGDTQVGALARALEEGPLEDSLYPAFPAGFRPRVVWQEAGICYVNLSSALLAELSEPEELPRALEALRRSLESLETVEETRFLVDGVYAADYGPVRLDEIP